MKVQVCKCTHFCIDNMKRSLNVESFISDVQIICITKISARMHFTDAQTHTKHMRD
jgi:hypothetical protein